MGVIVQTLRVIYWWRKFSTQLNSKRVVKILHEWGGRPVPAGLTLTRNPQILAAPHSSSGWSNSSILLHLFGNTAHWLSSFIFLFPIRAYARIYSQRVEGRNTHSKKREVCLEHRKDVFDDDICHGISATLGICWKVFELQPCHYLTDGTRKQKATCFVFALYYRKSKLLV